MPSYGSNKKLNNSDNKTNSNNRTNKNINIEPKEINVPQKELLIFFRQLSVILQSGVPLAQGIDLLSENTKNVKFSTVLRRIAARLSAGEDLSLCLKKYPKLFASITVGLIEAGETGGILDQVLERIANLIEDKEKIKSEIQGALIYPIIILVLAVTVSLGLLIFIVPKFEEMFKGFGAELPGLTKFMLLLSRIVTTPYFLLGAPIGVVLFLFLFQKYYKTKKGKLLVDKYILKAPLYGPLMLRTEMASMCDTMSTLMDSGIPLVDCMDRCISASSNQVVKNSINAAINSVVQGRELSFSFSQSNVFPRLVISMIKIGEETGQLSFMLENLSKFYKREVETAVSSLTKAMEPAVIIVIAAIVGTIVVALYLPMFKIITAVS